MRLYFVSVFILYAFVFYMRFYFIRVCVLYAFLFYIRFYFICVSNFYAFVFCLHFFLNSYAKCVPKCRAVSAEVSCCVCRSVVQCVPKCRTVIEYSHDIITRCMLHHIRPAPAIDKATTQSIKDIFVRNQPN